jgi:hypothetical protein
MAKSGSGLGLIFIAVLIVALLYYYSNYVPSQNLVGVYLKYNNSSYQNLWIVRLVSKNITTVQYDQIAKNASPTINDGNILLNIKIINETDNVTVFNKNYSIDLKNYTIFTNRTVSGNYAVIVNIPAYGFKKTINIVGN